MLKALFKRPPAAPPAEGAPQALPVEELLKLYVQEYCLRRHVCLKKMINMLEREIIFLVLEEAHGNQRAAAKLLGVRPNTLHYKIQRMGLVPVHKLGSFRYIGDTMGYDRCRHVSEAHDELWLSHSGVRVSQGSDPHRDDY